MSRCFWHIDDLYSCYTVVAKTFLGRSFFCQSYNFAFAFIWSKLICSYNLFKLILNHSRATMIPHLDCHFRYRCSSWNRRLICRKHWMYYICFSCRVTEFADHLHEHFIHPCVVDNGAYKVPMVSFLFLFSNNNEVKPIATTTATTIFFYSQSPGYSAEMRKESLEAYEFPGGSEWQNLIEDGLFTI